MLGEMFQQRIKFFLRRLQEMYVKGKENMKVDIYFLFIILLIIDMILFKLFISVFFFIFFFSI